MVAKKQTKPKKAKAKPSLKRGPKKKINTRPNGLSPKEYAEWLKKQGKSDLEAETKAIKDFALSLPAPSQGKKLDDVEAGHRHRMSALRRQQKVNAAVRDIAPLPNLSINWERRLRCKKSFAAFCKEYLPNVFYLDWSLDQLECISRIETLMENDGRFTLAMPRGGGKTALCRAAIAYAKCYGYRKFTILINSSAPASEVSLGALKTFFQSNPLLITDFPEIAYPCSRLENLWQANSQTFDGMPTHLSWHADEIRLPSLLLSEETVKRLGYLEHDPDSMIFMPEYKRYLAKSAGAIIKSVGIDGTIRGNAEVDKITLSQPRPDCVLLDDVQKDAKADSPIARSKLITLIDSAIEGLVGPGQGMAILMPCTVISEGDVADTYLDRTKKPDWKGKRCGMVVSWPEGITDEVIGVDTVAGKHWNKYNELRLKSLQEFDDYRLCNEYYQQNRAEMDANFVVSWEDRYDKSKELSAQQAAMNIRFRIPHTFASEYQNIGRKDKTNQIEIITKEELEDKIISSYDEFIVPTETQHITCFVDVQDEILYYLCLACDSDLNGIITHYGTWPSVQVPHFYKVQSAGWTLLSNSFFEAYPSQKAKATKDSKGRYKAPLEAKIYHALTELYAHLNKLMFFKKDQYNTKMSLSKIAIDTAWGQVSDVLKTFVRNQNNKDLYNYRSLPIPPTKKQLENYTRVPGWLFENQVNKGIPEVKWYYAPDEAGYWIIKTDVDRMKTFTMERLTTPFGLSGSIGLHGNKNHDMLVEHITKSEYPIQVSALGVDKYMWQVRSRQIDNDFLDCLVGAVMLQTMCGSSLKVAEPKAQTKHKRRLSDIWRSKRNKA